MPLVDLPTLNLFGQWTVNELERTVAARMAPAIPAAAAPGSDVAARWNAAYATLLFVRDEIRENGSLLFGDQKAIAPEPGSITLVDIMFATARALADGETALELHHAVHPDEPERLAPLLDQLEPDLARLRDHLAEAAGDAR